MPLSENVTTVLDTNRNLQEKSFGVLPETIRSAAANSNDRAYDSQVTINL